ncbi:MAG: hypothetical protein OXC62_00815 [Aestuariivita sp.]|nr:hypothetical protein [Aestuariivita sp.]
MRETLLGKPLDADAEFEHFDIYYVEAVLHTDNKHQISNTSEVAYFIHGKAAAMPPDGTARYNGRFRAKLFEYPDSVGDTPSSGFIRSNDMNLEFNFSDKTLTGTIASIQDRGRIGTDDEEYSEL